MMMGSSGEPDGGLRYAAKLHCNPVSSLTYIVNYGLATVLISAASLSSHNDSAPYSIHRPQEAEWMTRPSLAFCYLETISCMRRCKQQQWRPFPNLSVANPLPAS